MKTLLKLKGSLSRMALLVGVLLPLCFVSNGYSANYSLEVINIRLAETGNPAISASNRIFRAYPGIEYNIRPAVIGGTYPYSFSLSNAPRGMSINNITGEISWPNPLSSAQDIKIRVTDQNGDYVEEKWSITVTANGFRFVDDDGDDTSGNGSIGNPWRTLSYAISHASADDILYFRQGFYYVNATKQDNWIGRTDIDSPRIWLGYPGETATLDLNWGNRIGISVAVYFDNLVFQNSNKWMFYVSSSPNNYIFRRLILKDNLNGQTGDNSAFFRFERAGLGKYFVLQDSKLSNSDEKGMSIYATDKMLIEDNVWTDFGNTMVGVKEGVKQFTVRGNTFKNIHKTGAGMFGCMNYGTGTKTYGEVCFNFFKGANVQDGVARLPGDDFSPGPIHLYRNTFYGAVNIGWLSSDDGPYFFEDNVIVNNEDSNDGNSADHISNRSNGPDSLIQRIDNLVGYPMDNIIDNNGELQGTYRAQFLGTRGWEIGSDTPPSPLNLPSEATNFRIIDN